MKSKSVLVSRSNGYDRIVAGFHKGVGQDAERSVMFLGAFPLRSRVRFRATAMLDPDGTHEVQCKYATTIGRVGSLEYIAQCWVPSAWSGQRISFKFREVK